MKAMNDRKGKKGERKRIEEEGGGRGGERNEKGKGKGGGSKKGANETRFNAQAFLTMGDV